MTARAPIAPAAPTASGRGWLTLLAVVLVVGLSASGFFYSRSRSADLGQHARVVVAIGELRHESEAVSRQVLLARFGLANQYDGLTRASAALEAADIELDRRVKGAVAADASLLKALADLEAATTAQRDAAERFKSENALLRNSLYYLPTAAQEAQNGLSVDDSARRAGLSGGIERVLRTSLVYGLVGDSSAAAANAEAIEELEKARNHASVKEQARVDGLLSRARIIAARQPATDKWVERVTAAAPRERLADVQRLYDARFAVTVAEANRYRKILYVFSLVLLAAVVAAGVQLFRVYRGLEDRVVLRTRELGEALASLWGEMRLARKIQEALVPAKPSMRGREIAATMRATEEVGGDYYDVVAAGGRDWILVGDVSGHGVAAGLVMMMCQTAVRTILRRDPDVLPDRLLDLVNGVLTENVRRLGDDKYMTITALRFEPDGKVIYAGAHQDLFIYRAAENQVESLATRGVWLGLKEEIGTRLHNDRFELGDGDVLVLFTDGITEARKDGAIFDTGGIKKALLESGTKDANGVLASLFEALSGYAIEDDATAIVVRQGPVG